VNSFIARGKTIVFVSHSAEAIRSICKRVCVLEQGQLVFDGDVETGLQYYEDLLAGRSRA
jgi:ABC-type polysaccharide/polyol phosphate transport system ATPase subunit